MNCNHSYGKSYEQSHKFLSLVQNTPWSNAGILHNSDTSTICRYNTQVYHVPVHNKLKSTILYITNPRVLCIVVKSCFFHIIVNSLLIWLKQIYRKCWKIKSILMHNHKILSKNMNHTLPGSLTKQCHFRRHLLFPHFQ